jgi:phosphotransacetylase
VLTTASTVRRVVNITAIACVEAQIRAQQAVDAR